MGRLVTIGFAVNVDWATFGASSLCVVSSYHIFHLTYGRDGKLIIIVVRDHRQRDLILAFALGRAAHRREVRFIRDRDIVNGSYDRQRGRCR